MQEKVSIVMTSYNYAEYIAEAIESVIKQTYKNWELIIVDDASSDNSIEIINKYVQQDKRIKLFRHETNLGLSRSIYDGIVQASGKWIAFLESDDVFYENSIEKKVEAISTGADLIFTDLEMFGEKDEIEEKRKYFKGRTEVFVNFDNTGFVSNFTKYIPRINIIPTFSVVMVKKEFLLQCDYKPICKTSLDFYLWAQLSFLRIYYIHEKLTKWRIHSKSYLSKSKVNHIKQQLFYLTLYYQTIKHRNLFIRLFLLLNYIRARIIYFRICKEKFKLNMFDGLIIWEKYFNRQS